MWVSVRNGEVDVESRALDQGSTYLGRDEDCDVVIDDERASRRHARITVTPSGVVEVEDVGSTNGTYVNGVKVTGPRSVRPGDEIRVGRHVLRLSSEVPPPGPATVVSSPGTVLGPPAGRSTPPAADVAAVDSTTPVPALAAGRGDRPLMAGVLTTLVVIAAVIALLVMQLGGSSNLSAEQLARAWGPSTPYIQTDIGGQTQASGSGWVYNAKQGLIVTNAHVVNTGTNFTVGQGPQRQTATLVGVSVCQDLAVIKVPDTTGLRSFDPGRQSSVVRGASVTVLGYPVNAAPTPSLSETTGIVSVPQTSFTDTEGAEVPPYSDVIQVSAALNPGNSGGPVLDAKGRLIGVATASGSGSQNQGYAIGVDLVKTVVAQLAQGHSSGYTGMKLVFPTHNSDFTDLQLPVVAGGIIVQASDPNSPAFNAISSQIGNRPFVITAINNQALDGTLRSYCQIVGNLQSGATALFHVVLSDGNTADVRLPFE